MTAKFYDKSIGLLMTYRCNLRCQYCYIKTKKNIDMSLERAQSIIEPFLMTYGDLLDIKFYGGETLMAFNVIKQVVEWVNSKHWNRKYRFFGSTNGTLLTDEIKEWLSDHKESIVLGLSYDGLPESQLDNRGSDNIDIDFFLETWPEQPIQMTINQSSVNRMAEGVIYLLKKGAKVHPNVAFEENDWDNEALKEYANQLNKLLYFYNENNQYPPITQFIHNIREYARQIDAPKTAARMCGASDGFQVFDVDGKSYPCHLLSPLVIEGQKIEEIRHNVLNENTCLADSRCDACPYSSSCPTCLACNYLYRENFALRDKTHCEIMKIEVRAFIKKEFLRLKDKQILDGNDASLIDSLVKLRNFINSNTGY